MRLPERMAGHPEPGSAPHAATCVAVLDRAPPLPHVARRARGRRLRHAGRCRTPCGGRGHRDSVAAECELGLSGRTQRQDAVHLPRLPSPRGEQALPHERRGRCGTDPPVLSVPARVVRRAGWLRPGVVRVVRWRRHRSALRGCGCRAVGVLRDHTAARGLSSFVTPRSARIHSDGDAASGGSSKSCSDWRAGRDAKRRPSRRVTECGGGRRHSPRDGHRPRPGRRRGRSVDCGGSTGDGRGERRPSGRARRRHRRPAIASAPCPPSRRAISARSRTRIPAAATWSRARPLSSRASAR
jgi:hypothetical protein